MAELTVALNGIPVGILDKRTSGALSFRYLTEWLQRSGARPISLSLPLSDTSYQGEKVLNFFDNLLPDSESIRTRIQSTFRVASSHPFDLLAAVGRDCIGAIQIYPLGENISDVKQVISEPLTDADIENLLAGISRHHSAWMTTMTSVFHWRVPKRRQPYFGIRAVGKGHLEAHRPVIYSNYPSDS